MATSNGIKPPLKRESPDPAVHEPRSAKEQKRHYHHSHRLEEPLKVQVHGGVIDDDLSVDRLLQSSIGQVLSEAGFEQAEAVALDGMRDRTEEFLLRLLSYVRQSMYSCRRTQPIPHDFEHAFQKHPVSVDALHRYLQSSPPTHRHNTLLPTPPPEQPQPRNQFPFLGDDLSGSAHQAKLAHIPNHFPKLPSRHTYQETPVFTAREVNPRKIREQATEQGRLGEEALRKLTRAARDDRSVGRHRRERSRWGHGQESMETMFDKTLKSVSATSPAETSEQNQADTIEEPTLDLGLVSSLPAQKAPARERMKPRIKFEMGPIVNCDKDNWRRNGPTDGRLRGRTQESRAG